MKFAEVKELTSSELRKRVVTLRAELFEARMKHTLGQLGSPIEIRFKRRDLARLKTALVMKLGQGGVQKTSGAKKAVGAAKTSGAPKSGGAKKSGKAKG